MSLRGMLRNRVTIRRAPKPTVTTLGTFTEAAGPWPVVQTDVPAAVRDNVGALEQRPFGLRSEEAGRVIVLPPEVDVRENDHITDIKLHGQVVDPGTYHIRSLDDPGGLRRFWVATVERV